MVLDEIFVLRACAFGVIRSDHFVTEAATAASSARAAPGVTAASAARSATRARTERQRVIGLLGQMPARIRRSASASASESLLRVLPTGARHRAPTTASAADDRRGALDDIGGADLVRDDVVEVRDQRHLAVLDAAEHDRGRAVALLEAVGEVEQRALVEALDRLHDQVEAVLGADDSLDLTRRGDACGRLALQLLARLLELRPHGVELARAAVQERPRLAGGDGLDPARAGADRALGEDREAADLGGRADVGAAAELA